MGMEQSWPEPRGVLVTEATVGLLLKHSCSFLPVWRSTPLEISILRIGSTNAFVRSTQTELSQPLLEMAHRRSLATVVQQQLPASACRRMSQQTRQASFTLLTGLISGSEWSIPPGLSTQWLEVAGSAITASVSRRTKSMFCPSLWRSTPQDSCILLTRVRIECGRSVNRRRNRSRREPKSVFPPNPFLTPSATI